MGHENQQAASFATSIQLANDLIRSAKVFADRHVALVMEQEHLGPSCPFKKDTLLAISEHNKLIRHIEQFVFGHFQQIEFQNPAADHSNKCQFFNEKSECFHGAGACKTGKVQAYDAFGIPEELLPRAEDVPGGTKSGWKQKAEPVT